jgi:hypothetical protein
MLTAYQLLEGKARGRKKKKKALDEKTKCGTIVSIPRFVATVYRVSTGRVIY